jgi:hypothetical protein
MDPPSQDIFFERIVIQRPRRECEESFSAFVQKTKPALLPKQLTVKNAGFDFRQFLSVL